MISANYTANTLTVLLNAPTFSGGFAGDGSGLTSLNAGNLSGAVPSASLTSVPAGNLTGTVPDSWLSVNVALRAGGNTFYDDQICNGRLTVRTTADSSPGSVTAFDTRHMVVGTPSEGIAISYSSPNGKGYITAIAPNVAWKDLILQASTLSLRPSGGVEALAVLNNGFVGIGTNAPQQKLHVIGNILASGTISGSSDRNVKEHFNSVDAREVLAKVAALPIARRNYKTEKGVTHHGPMAQDFYSAFAVEDKQAQMTADFILHPSAGILYIILKESKTIGYVCLTFGFSFEYGGKIAFVDELFLKSDQRGKGIGSQVMDFIITKAKELKSATLHLEAEMHNEKANRLYSKKGFKNTNRYLLFNTLNSK